MGMGGAVGSPATGGGVPEQFWNTFRYWRRRRIVQAFQSRNAQRRSSQKRRKVEGWCLACGSRFIDTRRRAALPLRDDPTCSTREG